VKGANFSVSLSSGAVSGTSISGSTLTINLSGASNAHTLVVNVSDVRNFSTSASGNCTFSLGVLLADASGDGHVDLTDFTILAANFNGTNKSWTQADFNSDSNVDLTDFTILASNFNSTLLPAGGGSPGAALTAPIAARTVTQH